MYGTSKDVLAKGLPTEAELPTVAQCTAPERRISELTLRVSSGEERCKLHYWEQ